MSAAGSLPAREAYRLWADTYDETTAMNALDEHAVARLSPRSFERLLDAACGTGRALAAEAGGRGMRVGVDLVPEMLGVARRREAALRLLCADLLAFPFAEGSFDAVWCRLALGHVAELGGAYRELARVSEKGGAVIVTDVHPEAARRGLRRTFRDAKGSVHEVAHHRHELDAHVEAARDSGLRLDERLEPRIGPEIEAYFREAGALESYESQRGLPVLAAFRFTRIA
jgi:malonyl-CoA O-methyltransferase